MKLSRVSMLFGLIALASLAANGAADTKVELKGVHLCCGACVKAVGNIAKDVEGVKAVCDAKSGTVTITATDAKAAQKLLDALAAAGFHGDSGTKEVAIKDDSGAATGKVKSITVSGAHNCCNSCCRALKATVSKVDGVTGDTAKPKEASFEVTGDFDATDLVKALNAAGFHVKVKK